MAFNYDKLKHKHEEENYWTSYSDLLTLMSVIFLFLYVTSSLKIGSQGVQQGVELKALAEENERLKDQLRTYESLKEEYVEEGASEEELRNYKQLMGQLDLLQDEAKTEKEELQKKAQENAEKEQALNKYQQMIKNVISANMISQSRIKDRENIIAAKDKDIKDKKTELRRSKMLLYQRQQEIRELNTTLDEKKALIEENDFKIAKAKEQLDKQIAALEKAREDKELSEKSYEMQMHKLKSQSEEKLSELTQKKMQAERQLQALNNDLENASSKLTKAQKQIQQSESEKESLKQKIGETEAQYQARMSELKGTYEKKLGDTEAGYEKNIAEMKGSYEKQIGDKEAEYQKQLGEVEGLYKKRLGESEAGYKKRLGDLKGLYEQRLGESEAGYQKRLGELKGFYDKKMGETEADYGRRIGDLEGQYKKKLGETEGQYKRRIGEVEKKLGMAEEQVGRVSGELQRAKELEDVRRKIAQQLKDKFRNAGVPININENTGEVTISFGDEYFDTGRADLKPGMKATLKKFIPLYSKALFEDVKIAEKITSIDIVGFASPTYKGRYVDPQTLAKSDRKAVEMNLDLSYNRAKSIFTFIFDVDNMEYDNQKKLQSLVNVTGKSFLAEKTRATASAMTIKEFCKAYDCKKAQKVIIKFNVD